MGLRQTQQALAQLYTDGPLCERFFADPEGEGAGLGLDAAESQQLAPVQEEIRFFSRSLLHKRAGELAKRLPRTRHALGSEFLPLFFRYADTGLSQGARKHVADALGFAEYLTAEVSAECGEVGERSAWIADLARYEAGRVRAAECDCWFLMVPLRYRVRPAVGVQCGNGRSEIPWRQPSLAIWVRLPQGRLRQSLLVFPPIFSRSRERVR